MWVFILLSLKLQHIDKKMRWIQWNENWIDLGIVTTSKLELKLLPEVKLELWHSVRGNFRNLNSNVLNYRVECVFRIWQVSFTSQVFPSSYKQLSIGDHKIRPIFSIILNLSSTGRYAGSAAGLRTLGVRMKRPLGDLPASRNSIIQ